MSEYNFIKVNNKIYKCESFWQEIFKIKKDLKNRPFPNLKIKEIWHMKNLFISKLKKIQNILGSITIDKFNINKCNICNNRIKNKFYLLNNILWPKFLIHYIDKHNIIPSESFIDFIIRYENNPTIINKVKHKITGQIIVKYDKTYLKIHKNQIFIMDSLMKHGKKKIYSHKSKLKFSEHAGLLNFNNNSLIQILVYANTNIISKGDSDIFFPNSLQDAYKYEYIFHTHPPTHSYGGRAINGILYEFPSINDIFHFLDHYNNGMIQGSIVIAPEGMYIIRKHIVDNKKIFVDEDKLYNDFNTKFFNIQNKAISIYGISFTKDDFLSSVAQDYKYINKLNNILHKYFLHIDYYSRILEHNEWIIDTIYVPIYSVEKE